MRVLITGGDGQLGHSLRRETADLAWSVTVCNRTELDITDAARVDAAVAELQPQLVINAAAYTAVDRAESEREAAFAVNAHGAGHLAQAAAAVGAACFHVSTDYVFSGESDTAYRETDAPSPCGVYGESKLAQGIRGKTRGTIQLKSRCQLPSVNIIEAKLDVAG